MIDRRSQVRPPAREPHTLPASVYDPRAQTIERPQRTCAWCGRRIDVVATHSPAGVLCSGCGVANTDPWPTDAELNAAYGSWYRPASGRFSGPGDAILRRTRGRLARRLDRIAPPGPVLDVGAGDGALLAALAARGRAAIGSERSEHQVSRADVRVGGLAEIGGEWAAIVFWHSLEHLPDAGEELERAAAMLASDGVLVIAVPNADSLQARLLEERWLALDLPRHLVHLPARALVRRLRALGLEVERISYWRGGQVIFGWPHGIVGMLPGHPDLYDSIRRPEARSRRRSGSARMLVLAAAALCAPLATIAATAEVVARRGGTV